MKYLNLNIIALFYFLTSLTFTNSAFSQNEIYCNDRFNFCLQYPSDVLSESISSTNGDGVTLQSTNGKLIVKVSGIYNPLNNSIEEELMLFKQYLANQKPGFSIYTSHLEVDQFSILAASQKEACFYKTVSAGNHMLNLSIMTKGLLLEQSKEAIENIEKDLIFLVYP